MISAKAVRGETKAWLSKTLSIWELVSLFDQEDYLNKKSFSLLLSEVNQVK